MSLKVFFPRTHFSTHIISLTFFKMPSISLNSNFYNFWIKFPKSWYLFIPNFARVISNFTKLLVRTFSFMKFTSIKILFTLSCLFIYINTWTKHFNSDFRIYHHSYNLIYPFPSFFEILTFININNIIQGFTMINLNKARTKSFIKSISQSIKYWWMKPRKIVF
jgi:hypothetical protein